MRRFLVSILLNLVKSHRLNTVIDFIVRNRLNTSITVKHKEIALRLTHPNPQIRSRNLTFATKEPDTLRWIDSFEDGDTLWDIGANVGLYSIYAAKRGCRVTAFEPSVFNLEFLVRNIELNELSNLINVAPIAIGGIGVGFSKMGTASTAWGDSQNDFGETPNQADASKLHSTSYRILGMPLDSVEFILRLSKPHHIKIDVDGIEPLILEGGPNTLRWVKSVLVETPLYDGAVERISSSLSNAGLQLVATSRQIFAERLRCDTHTRGELSTLVFIVVDKAHNAAHKFGVMTEGDDLCGGAILFDIQRKHRVEHVIRWQTLVISLVGSQLG
ncbi:MAG: FkbM family methyltransferase [Acidimicrobiia bacterium]|nr:FkbM family methyltransferase [Acidimicrobiia bacterium]